MMVESMKVQAREVDDEVGGGRQSVEYREQLRPRCEIMVADQPQDHRARHPAGLQARHLGLHDAVPLTEICRRARIRVLTPGAFRRASGDRRCWCERGIAAKFSSIHVTVKPRRARPRAGLSRREVLQHPVRGTDPGVSSSRKGLNIMGISTSLVLIAVGAILKWAVTASTSGINLNTVGVVLMVVGAVGLVLSFIFWSSWGGFGSRRRRDDRRSRRHADAALPRASSGSRHAAAGLAAGAVRARVEAVARTAPRSPATAEHGRRADHRPPERRAAADRRWCWSCAGKRVRSLDTRAAPLES